MKMWEGRFKKALDSRVNDFNSSISFDARMYKEDIEGSVAHVKMLGRCGIIEQKEADLIADTLLSILADLESGTLVPDPEAEDIHMFVEQVLTERIGDTGKRLHTARSRNDQVALDIRMYLKNQNLEIQSLLFRLLSCIAKTAEQNIDTIMPGYTHLQRAQPVTFAHYVLAYAQMFRRDIQRLKEVYEHTNVMPLGSCALAGTTYPIDRDYVARELGFASVTENSLDGVSDRDFVIELAHANAQISMHLSRFSEEIILWCSSEFHFVELDDAFSTGSSIMPQKKNPDIAELVRGKAGRVYGDLITLLTVMKGLPLAYNKDMQEDKEAIFDSIDQVKICLELFTSMLDTLKVRPDVMRQAASGGFINATDCADYLVKNGMPFRSAYKIVGQIVAYCLETGKTFETLSLEEYHSFDPSFDSSVYDAINLEKCVDERKVKGGPSRDSVQKQLQSLKSFIEAK
ncbi:MAG: argininosuccinate lyase [Clostridia bacterium]|nr:argininosuccinate lyase [Clostridia bacterium]